LIDNPHPWDVPGAAIPVERIRSPVLLNCGGNDQIWTSCASAKAIVRRRRGHDLETLLYVYPKAGHYVGSPFMVYEPGWLASDLFVPWDERGREDSWPRVVAFLRARQ